ncbi:MAG: M23 family metallopeptidase [Syntrophobacteraceae bacterium]
MKPLDTLFYTDFSKDLAKQNRLLEQKFLRWVFYPGMLFKSREKWWGDMGERVRPHEGLDIGFFLDLLGKTVPIGNDVVVPVMFQGEVLTFGEDDFFGYTLYVKHHAIQERGKVLCTIYGHVTPHDDLYPGKVVQTGETIASISDFGTPKSGIKAHLHLSVAWIVESSTKGTLTWGMLNDSRFFQLIDPIVFFADSYSVIDSIFPSTFS